jgi:hypothetical protein
MSREPEPRAGEIRGQISNTGLHVPKKVSIKFFFRKGRVIFFKGSLGILHPHGISPTFLKLDSWSPGAGF